MTLAEFLSSPAMWGLLGAFVYAAPKLSACIYQCRSAGHTWRWCAFEAFLALAIGAISAGALTAWAAEVLRANQAHKLPAIAGVIGLMANPLAPGLIDALSGRILKRIRDGGNGSGS